MKKDRNNLLLGIIIGFVCIPIVENAVDIIVNSMDVIRCKVSQKILKENKIIEGLQAEQEEIDTYAIGFDLSPKEEYYEDDDEYFDDRNKNKVGF